MQYVKIVSYTPYTDEVKYLAFHSPLSDNELQELADEEALLFGDSYEYTALCDDYEDILDDYWNDVYGWFEIVTEEEWRKNNGTIGN